MSRPQFQLEHIKDKYFRKFGRYSKSTEGNIKQMSEISIHMKDTYSTNITCGVLGDEEKKLMAVEWSIAGNEVPDKLWPWQVMIKSRTQICGGVLISDSWIITAAQCVDRTDFIVLGAKVINTLKNHSLVEKPSAEIIHKEYRKDRHGHDIGLLKIQNPVRFTDFIRPVCVLAWNSTVRLSGCFFTTWGFYDALNFGLHDDLHAFPVHVYDQYECHFRWIITGLNVTNGDLCVRFDYSGSGPDLCSQDSGGPLICKIDEVHYVIGVTSFVQSGCRKRFLPDLFARVSYFENWILNKIL